MKKNVMELWVKALRSGEYKQGIGTLRKASTKSASDEYCCLGVLCDISKRGAWNPPGMTGVREYLVGGDRIGGLVPYKVRDWAEMKSSNGTRSGEYAPPLYQLNDSKGGPSGGRNHTFQEIADIIEKEWESL